MSNLTLYELTDTLPALLDSLEMTPEGSPERAECLSLIQEYMEHLPQKVDAVAHVRAHLKSQAQMAEEEIERLKARRAAIEANLERLDGYIARCLETLPEPAKGPRKLTGATSTLRLVGNGGQQALTITDEGQLPAGAREVVITMPAEEWLKFKNQEVFVQHGAKITYRTVTAWLRALIDREGGVPGARLEPRGYHVEVK